METKVNIVNLKLIERAQHLRRIHEPIPLFEARLSEVVDIWFGSCSEEHFWSSSRPSLNFQVLEPDIHQPGLGTLSDT